MLALRAYARLLIEQSSILAGDLNNHVRWDRFGKASNHTNTVIAGAALALVSAYHAFHGLDQGAERYRRSTGVIHPKRADFPHRLCLRAEI
jgi:hypothetical protein